MYARAKTIIWQDTKGYRIILYKNKSRVWRLLYTRTKARVYDDYCIQEQKIEYMTISIQVYDDYFIQEQKLGYMTIIVCKNKS